MSERDHILAGLVKDLLGPRHGPFETLPENQDPRNEYITGVLAPEQAQLDSTNVDADTDEISEEVSDDEVPGTIEGVVIAPPSAFSPALNPKAQPRSIGLTFVLKADAAGSVPIIDICAGWARYQKQGDQWARQPQVQILRGIITDTDQARWQVGPDVDLYMRVRYSHEDKTYRISLYLINERRVADDRPLETSDFLFQPQIRVHCVAGQPTPVDMTATPVVQDPIAQEDVELTMLYSERPVLARGHLCGATWKAIDPERPHPSLLPPSEAPFTWVDRELVPAEDQEKFSPADVRTEFIPCYPVESPEIGWPVSAISPQLDPLALAEMWDAEEIHAYLDPLVDGYTQWIEEQARQVAEQPFRWQGPAMENLDRCRQAAARMREGIDWLVRDADVRLAFCFANKAIALQSRWARGSAVSWRPFQLAFILLNISGQADPAHADRQICDLLWFPTGGGKTEAYLGLAAFTLALRRLRARRKRDADQGGGVGVLSRYTLRLLTIQQFRRALGIITACEFLRVANLGREENGPVGWRPAKCADGTRFLWGSIRFSAGMWVGGDVTPNNLTGFHFPLPTGQMQHIAGAIEILQGVSTHGYDGPIQVLRRAWGGHRVDASGDPAQVLSCPACRSLLAVPAAGLAIGQHTLHFVFSAHLRSPHVTPSAIGNGVIHVDEVSPIVSHTTPDTHTISITFTVPENRSFSDRNIDDWWYNTIRPAIPTVTGTPQLLATRPSRPGYFLCSFQNRRGNATTNNFEIYCPDPRCELNHHDWGEQLPANGVSSGESGQQRTDWQWREVLPFVRKGRSPRQAERIPIPACTVDEQVYQQCPSLVIATVDKFARLAFEPKAASLFGNVTHYHTRWGYYREGCPPGNSSNTDVAWHPPVENLRVSVPPFLPPDLIIQDELHLIEGPLGSMVGIYETAIDALCERDFPGTKVRPKYVASSATVRQAENQVQALFARRLASFPPSALRVDDRFFARTYESHPLECVDAGRLYVGVSAPGKGAQTPIVRIWSALLQTVYQRQRAGAGDELDSFWTLVGYFNALRELAGAAALYRQDIPERLQSWDDHRGLDSTPMELSSRSSSLNLPSMLERLGRLWSEDAVLATSMFGTGVDVDRLGLMVVHGQPKTTASYIQATGRVGRSCGGLVVTFFRVSRPRDLDHYEFFTGYHRRLYRAVEPITVAPFAPRARERCLGPLAVALLRQAREIEGVPVDYPWRMEQRVRGGIYSEAVSMAEFRHCAEVDALPPLFEQRAREQPPGRRPPEQIVEIEAASELDRWASIAHDVRRVGGWANNNLVYTESSMVREPQRSVILGDAQHQLRQLPVAFENAPNSLRDVEETIQFQE
jgi:hypothetical protein